MRDRPSQASNPPTSPAIQGDWKSETIVTVRMVMLRLIDREHLSTLLAFFVLLIILVVAVRIPATSLGELPQLVGWFVRNDRFVIVALSLTAVVLVSACILLGVSMSMLRRHHLTEMEREKTYSRGLEARLGLGKLPAHERESSPAAVPLSAAQAIETK